MEKTRINKPILLGHVNLDKFTSLLILLYGKTLTPTNYRETKTRSFKEHDGLKIATGKDGLYVNDLSGNSNIAKGNAINVIMSAKNFAFVKACYFLGDFLGLSKNQYTTQIKESTKPSSKKGITSPPKPSTPSKKNSTSPSINPSFKIKKWSKAQKEVEYLCTKIGAQTLDTIWLEKHGVFPLAERTNKDGYTIKYEGDDIGILFTDNPKLPSNGHNKTKQPNHKNPKFKSMAIGAIKPYIFNYKNLPQTGDNLIICEGESDCLAMLYHFGKDETVSYICFGSVNTYPDMIFEELKRRFENIYLLFDNDENDVGQNFAKNLSAKYNICYIDISQHTKQNDVCKIVQNEGIPFLQELLIEELAQERKADIIEEFEGNEIREFGTLDFLEILRKSEIDLREKSVMDIEFSKPFIECRGTGIIYPNTINVIQGKKGSHKSRLGENLVALLLNKEGKGFCGFNKRKDDKTEYSVLYVDTERNTQDQFPHAIQKMKFLAGYKKKEVCKNLNAVSLIQIPRQERAKVLSLFIQEKTKNLQGHLLIVLDVLTDCLGDFNNLADTNNLMDTINATIQKTNSTFLGIIHENPNSEKARGHIGTEAGNKVSSQISIGFVRNEEKEKTDLIKVKFLKTRMGKDQSNLLLKFSDQHNNLVEVDVDEVESLKNVTSITCTVDEVKQYIRSKQDILYFGKLVEANKLYADIQQYFSVSLNTVKSRLIPLYTEGIEIQDTLYRLKKVGGKGKKLMLKLEKVKSKKGKK